jgi:hypothetical protein
MIEFIVLIVVGVGCFMLGWKGREIRAMQYLRHYQELIDEAAKAEVDKTVMIEIRREGDQFYIYNKSTGEFLAQGTNHEEVSAVLGERFPSKRFTAMPENLKEVGYKHDTI